ncbi:MAG: hypothetical protein ABMA15_27815, partial [Vicinamibacterales bacterium]
SCNLSYYDCRATQSPLTPRRTPTKTDRRLRTRPARATVSTQSRNRFAPEEPPLVVVRIRTRRRAVDLTTAQDRARIVHDDRMHGPLAPLRGE